MKRYRFNLKRISSGNYETTDGLYYVIRSVKENGKGFYWTAGKRINNQSQVLEDFTNYSHARTYLMKLDLAKEAK